MRQNEGVTPSGSGHQPSASAPICVGSSQSGVPNADAALSQFGARMFSKLFEEFCEGAYEIELFDFIQIDAVKAGLVEKTAYDPDVHTNGEYCEPGDDYYALTPLGSEALAKARGESQSA